MFAFWQVYETKIVSRNGHFLGFCFGAELNKNPPEGVSVGLADDDNMFIWELLIVGPPDTVRNGYRAVGKLFCPGL